jgi:hypothetical protein
VTRVDPSLPNVIVILTLLVIALVLAHLYFLHVTIPRPPVGFYDLRDVMIMMAVVVVLPPLYLRLPDGLITALLAVPFLAIVQFSLAPLLPRPLPLLLAVGVVALDIALSMSGAETGGHAAFIVLNDVLVLIAVVGVVNLYLQNGMHARTVAVFAVALAVYDVIASILFPTMVEFFFRVQDLPLAPLVSWGEGEATAAIGLGDVIALVLWPLAALKAFGRMPAWIGVILGLSAVTGIFAAMSVGLVDQGLPAMVALGPLVGLQYAFWRRRRTERTIADYRRGLSPGTVFVPSDPSGEAWDSVMAAVRWLRDHGTAPSSRGRYVALREGELVGSGSVPGDARRVSRVTAPRTLPVVIHVPADEDHPRLTPGSLALPAMGTSPPPP